MDMLKKAQEYQHEALATRRDIHRHPELSGHEKRTSALVSARLSELGIPHTRLAGYGVLGVIDSGRPGPTVALRCDMDALPVGEETGLPYASETPGVAHLCGHDIHTAGLLTAARILQERRHTLRGTVRLIFQPSEETGPGGAREMVAGGAMDGVHAVFGVHVTPALEAGQVSVEAGCRMAASLHAYFDVIGKGGHGGLPHETVDAVVAASAIVLNLQTLVSREINVFDPVAVTVGLFNAGNAFNAVSERVHMEATVKFFDSRLAQTLSDSITRVAKNTAQAFRASCDVTVSGYCAPVVNDRELCALAAQSAEKLLGSRGVCEMPPMSASEDFSVYLEKAPGVFAFLGCRGADTQESYPLHHPQFTPDEGVLPVATALYCQFAADYLSPDPGTGRL